MNIKTFNTPEEMADAVSLNLLQLLNRKSELQQDFYLAVSGGSTPKILFNKLSGDSYNKKINWKHLHFFWVDERCVPPDHPESNYGMTKKFLLNKIIIPEENIHRIKGEADPFHEMFSYSSEIKKIIPSKNSLPSFDLILLGMGSDGHTASLFPEKKLTDTADQICGIAIHPQTNQKRITLTLEVINNAEQIYFMVAGKDKAETLSEIFTKKPEAEIYPVSKINPISGILEWYVDKEALL